MDSRTQPAVPAEAIPLPTGLPLPLEVRVHGRGGQGGVTCAKLIAALYTQMGLHVQTFGDYGSERSGAPVQAYTRVDRRVIANRNKVYHPHHLIVLDEGLLGPAVLAGASPGGLLLLNSHEPLERFADRYGEYRFGVIDATSIAREHGIGSASVVIINTTLIGAYARLLGISLDALDRAFALLGLESDLAAAEHAYEALGMRAPVGEAPAPAAPGALPVPPPVMPLGQHSADIPAVLKTGTWSNLAPRYREQAAPCNVACPAGNDVVAFIQALRHGGVEEAAGILLRTQPLPSVCGRVCPAPCMTHCNRAAFDGTVNIRGLERWIGDHAVLELAHETPGRRRRFAVVGGGPAGLSAAYQLALRGQGVTLFEAGPALGGVLRNGIPAFRLPDEPLRRDLARVTGLGVQVRCDARLGRGDVERLLDGHDAVIVCTGFGAATGLAAEGADLSGIEQGLDFLDRVKRGEGGVSGHVVVVGGGNTAIDCVRSALRGGAESVRLVYRRGREDMPAIGEEIDAAELEGVRLGFYGQPVAFQGQGRVESVVVAEVEAGPPDASGRRRPVVTDRTTALPCDHVLLALGQGTEVALLPEGWQKRGDRAWRGGEALPVWFAGDCGTADGTVTHAIGNGRRVALRALADVEHPGVEPAQAPAADPVAPGQIRFAHYGVAPPHADRQRPPAECIGSFAEVNLGLAGPEEAERCFSCGHCTRCDTCLVYCPDGVISRSGDGYAIDEAYCKGCGMCVAECPRSAMEMHEKHLPGAAP
ncbi:MAG: FAD-dependent oxidoreductase [Rhodocyclaceae bacterium]|nr:FAD-dependent oxidoreductase [Rhodocyclaceae bacterium]